MVIIGLTGSIGMGKSTVAARFRERGVPVFDADAEVHKLYEGAAVGPIESTFPGTTAGGKVDRVKLAQAVVGDPAQLKRLEDLVHPLVRAAEAQFLKAQLERGREMTVLEIPLLFETSGDALVDATVVVSAPHSEQRSRVLTRPGMTLEKLQAIVARQMSDAEKRRRATFVVDTGGSIEASYAQVDAIIDSLRNKAGQAYDRFWRD